MNTRLSSSTAFALLLFWLSLGNVLARSSYGNLIPNRSSVPNPNGSGSSCLGVGHLSCFGSGARNTFGSDFFAADRTWNVGLCNKDIDGDGLTNGVELGDPCCQWTVERGFGSIKGTEVSHPGFASSILKSIPETTCNTTASPPAVAPPAVLPPTGSDAFSASGLFATAAVIFAATAYFSFA